MQRSVQSQITHRRTSRYPSRQRTPFRTLVVVACSIALLGTAPIRAQEELLPDYYVPGTVEMSIEPPEAEWQIATIDSDGNLVTNESAWRAAGDSDASVAPGSQTDVEIFARELRFEGDDAALDTTPLSYTRRASVHGLAGNVALNVAAVSAPPGNSPRFVLHGGKGQDPRKAISHCGEGNVCLDIYRADNTLFNYWPGGTTVYPVIGYTEDRWSALGFLYDTRTVGSTSCTSDGADARQAGGVPGAGGNGGTLRAPFDLSAVTDLTGGDAGEAQPVARGGNGDTPYNAVRLFRWVQLDVLGNVSYRSPWEVTAYCGNYPGKSYPATSNNPGADNVVELDIAATDWLRPASVRSVLAYVKDAYLNGDFATARRFVKTYHAVLTTLNSSDDVALNQVRAEVATLLNRLDSHLDYFGKPAGWVPMYSFEFTKELFEDEVAAAGDILYLTYYLGNIASAVEDRLAAVTRMQEELREEIAQYEIDLGACARMRS